MDFLLDFIKYLSLVNLLELLAAISGSYYLAKTGDKTIVRTLVWFLWLTVFVEIVANYPSMAYYSNYNYFSFVEGTPFAANYWWYNCYNLISFPMYILFFVVYLKNDRLKKILNILIVIYVFAAILYLLMSDVFFETHSLFTIFFGTILLVFAIMAYYFELLKSDRILKIHKMMPFYVSVGALVFFLAFVPLVIYGRYFNLESPFFVEMHQKVLFGVNYFLYSIYIIGFLICSRKKKFY